MERKRGLSRTTHLGQNQGFHGSQLEALQCDVLGVWGGGHGIDPNAHDLTCD